MIERETPSRPGFGVVKYKLTQKVDEMLEKLYAGHSKNCIQLFP